LLKLGFDDKNLRVVILKDLKRNKDHSNLVVYLDEKKYILDNLYVNIYTDEKFKHYKPKYSFNQKNAWIHFQSN
jgi:predicted transglutaminase-like cysteine proteinase